MILCSEYGVGVPNTIICSFVCDSVSELMSDAPTTTKKGSGSFADFNHYANIGSTATVNDSGNITIYMLFSDGWHEL